MKTDNMALLVGGISTVAGFCLTQAIGVHSLTAACVAGMWFLAAEMAYAPTMTNTSTLPQVVKRFRYQQIDRPYVGYFCTLVAVGFLVESVFLMFR